jgi:hypothetical protein
MRKPALMLMIFSMVAAGCSSNPQRFAETTPSRLNSCLTTGSHIASKQRSCTFATGRSYSKEDINATGAATTAGALVALDPAITSR